MIAKHRDRSGRAAGHSFAPLSMRLSACLIRFLLTAVLAGAEILDGRAFFALSAVGVCRPGLEGLAALLGAALGYLSFRGFVEGLRYIAACMMVYAVALALGEFRIYRMRWFMPTVCSVLNGLVGFVYQSAAGWSSTTLAGFFSEIVLTAGTVYFYRLAFDLMEHARAGGGLTVQQTVGVLVFAMSVMLTLARIMVADMYSLGRVLCVCGVVAAAWKGNVGAGTIAGVAGGLAMDLSEGTAPYYILAYSVPGLVTGIFSDQSRMLCALAYVLSSGAVMLWSGASVENTAYIYEAVAGAVIFLLVPDGLIRRMASLFRQERSEEMGIQPRQNAVRRLERTAAAFREVHTDLECSFSETAGKEEVSVFDRAAERVCKTCGQWERCWKQEYQATRTILNDAGVAALDRGEGLREDFPAQFVSRCGRFDRFLYAANLELGALLHRRRYDNRIRESRSAVCAQYGQMARLLERTASSLEQDLQVDVPRQLLVKQRMTALGLEGCCCVWRDEYGHLQIEVNGPGAEQLAQPGELTRLAALMGVPLRSLSSESGMVRIAQKEPLRAVAAVAAADREGQCVSGDVGAWFKDDSGKLNVVLCDGMGSGPSAREDSSCALSLVEKFLRAGLSPEEVLSTVGEALALRGEQQGGFTTVDLLQVDLYSGRGALYKLGAAPSYLKQGAEVERLEGVALPAGILLNSSEPDRLILKLDAGDCVVMISDGIGCGPDDRWLKELVRGFDGRSPRELANGILQESSRREGRGDDRTVMVLKIEQRQ